MRQAPGLHTADGKPYALFRNTSTRIEHAARKGKADESPLRKSKRHEHGSN